ncbi:MAG: hypothetical protein KC461_01985 [Dehalococcoidia bacterium]|nr:hypothetical protein [Dehalococcoidia bacterium]
MTVWVGRYAMVSGQVREHGPWLVDRVRRSEDQELRVVVLAEPTDARSAEFCHEVAEAVAVLFARESLSITGGLLRALRQAHANLAEWNRRSLREHRVAVGVTCAVVRDGREVLLAQVGPGVAYVREGDRITRYHTAELPAATPIGSPDPIEPLFTSLTLNDGQLLLLTENAEAALGRHTIENALNAGPEQALAQLFPHTRGLTDMNAVLIADLDIDEDQIAAPLDFEEEPEEIEGREVAFTGMDDIPEPPPVRRPRGWKVLGSGEDGGAPRPPLPSIRRTRTVGGRGNALAPLVPWRTVALVAAAAVGLALLAWLVLPGILSEDRAAELDTAIAQAEAQLEVAATAESADSQREALQAALTEAERARALAPDDPRIEQIVANAEARLAALDAVTNVENLERLVTFEGTITAPVQPEELVAGGNALWLRESGRGRVIRLDPAGEAEPVEVYRAGETYGDVTARDPAAIAWDASTQRLLIIDAGRSLFAVDIGNDTAAPLALRDADEMRSVAGIAVYLGNLYILDPDGGEVWRYLPAAEGFDSERTGILGGVDLAGSTGLAVDGEVFVLDAPSLRHFVQGREEEPMLRGIDTPTETPVGLVEDVLREIVYVADRGGGRIVASDREGEFFRQYRHPDFIDLRGVAVAPDGTALYALTSDGISSFPVTPR